MSISVHNVSKVFGTQYALNDVSFEIGKGEIVGFLGPNGAGKSTMMNKKIGALSHGYKQRVGLAQALIHNPEVLILDEPTTGLDPNQLVEIRELIKKYGKTKTVLLSTHIMQEVEAVCDRIIITNKGKIVADAKIDEIRKMTEKMGFKRQEERTTNLEMEELFHQLTR